MRSSCSSVMAGGRTKSPNSRRSWAVARGNKNSRHQRNRRQRAEHRRQPTSRKGATTDVNRCVTVPIVRRRCRRRCAVSSNLLDDSLRDIVLRLNDDGTERRIMGVCGAAVVHRDGEKADRAKRLAVRRDLFQMPTQRFFSFVDDSRRPETAGRTRSADYSGPPAAADLRLWIATASSV